MVSLSSLLNGLNKDRISDHHECLETQNVTLQESRRNNFVDGAAVAVLPQPRARPVLADAVQLRLPPVGALGIEKPWHTPQPTSEIYQCFGLI